MTTTLERTDVFETAFVVVDGDDYLDARLPAWAALEQSGAVEARGRKVYVSAGASDVLAAVALAFPAKYTAPGERL